MDEVAVGAITAVWHRDFDYARRWFEAIGAAYQALVESGSPRDWDSFRRDLDQRASRDAFGPEAVEGFTSYLENHCADPLDVVRQLADPQVRDELMSTYSLAVEQALASGRELR